MGEVAYEGRDLEAMSFARNYHAWIRDELRAHLAGDVAEIGAGDGRFSQLLLECGPRSLTLFEPSRAMFELQPATLGDAAGVTRHCGTLAEFAPGLRQSFDAIVYNNVLEHVADDAAELALVRECLRPGGVACIFVPALPALMSDFDRRIGHHRRYTRRSLEACIARGGLALERLHYVDAAGVLPWLVAMRWLRGDLDRRKVAAYDRVAVPVVRWLETRLRPPIGKNLLAVARRAA